MIQATETKKGTQRTHNHQKFLWTFLTRKLFHSSPNSMWIK
jgi:hypothetical protein